jgi:riboflavin kinase/FMN adenylyltransferase
VKILSEGDRLPAGWGATAVSIGAFDGVHLGHRALIGEMKLRASELGVASVVVTFDRHPATVVRPESAPKLLTDLPHRLELLASTGVDGVLVARFDASRAAQAAEDFVVRVLVDQLRVRLVVVGQNFHFGRGRVGDLALLAKLGESYGFDVEGVELVAGDRGRAGDSGGSGPISSTRIRALLAEGQVEEAAELLGRDHEVRGTVVRGDGRGGAELGCPTANVAVDPAIALPKLGIYAGYADGPGFTDAPMVASLGVRPTYHSSADPLLEVHLIDFEGDLYGAELKVRFRRRLRDEVAFSSSAELVAQIERDLADARRTLGL